MKKFTTNTSKINPSSINELTEIESGYKLLNINLADCYNGLHPSGLSKLSNVIFNCILFNKIYKKPESKGYNEEEAKRIFTSILVQPQDLAKRLNPVKYSNGEKDIDTDISNILKSLSELEEMNIFYIWKFRQPYTFMFIMERDITSWRYYNKEGYVFPKGLKKILKLSKSMIDTMIVLESQRGRIPDRQVIEEAYGEFINKMIDKMNPEVSKNLTRWTKGVNIFSYISNVTGELKKMNDHEGCIYDNSFIHRLPEHIQKKVIKSNKEAIMYTEALELEVIPQDGNLVKTRKEKKPKVVKTTKSINELTGQLNDITPEAKQFEFESCDPFKNPTEFTKYYRSFLRLYNRETRFYSFTEEVLLSADVLDKLALNNRSNLKFLKSWLRFYVVESLKGNNPLKEEKTSIGSFKKTFDSYNLNYIG